MNDERSTTTKYWRVDDPREPEGAAAVREAAALLKEGKTVAFPTETVYGLGADARSDRAVEAIFAAKGRPSDNPLIVHIADPAQLHELAGSVPSAAERLIERFWPGPLTIVCPVKPGAVSARTTAGLSTVAVRMPDHPVALALIEAAGCPVAAPSANRSGRPSPTQARHVLEDLDGRIAGVLDGGPCAVGVESTVVECDGDEVVVLRPGGIDLDRLRSVVPSVRLDRSLAPASLAANASPSAPRSPGMKYAHYAPQGRLVVFTGASPERVGQAIRAELEAARRRGERTGVLTFDEHVGRYEADLVLSYGSFGHTEEAAQRLYEALRRFDRARIAFIAAEGPPEEGLGFTVMNRLIKAAAGAWLRV
jgi:L-threonylcarbamoyladenylate synthase